MINHSQHTPLTPLTPYFLINPQHEWLTDPHFKIKSFLFSVKQSSDSQISLIVDADDQYSPHWQQTERSWAFLFKLFLRSFLIYIQYEKKKCGEREKKKDPSYFHISNKLIIVFVCKKFKIKNFIAVHCIVLNLRSI